MIENRNGTILADRHNEISFLHAAEQLRHSMLVEWQERVNKLREAFGITQPMTGEMRIVLGKE